MQREQPGEPTAWPRTLTAVRQRYASARCGRAVNRTSLWILLAALMVTLGVLATASPAGASTKAGKPKAGGTITFGGGPTPTVLDWTQTGFAGPGAATQMEEFGSLFLDSTRPEGGYIPDLATSYHFNTAGTQFTMTLRPGLKFADGTPLDAQAVVYNWSSSRDASPLAFTSQYFAPVTSVTATGPRTVVVDFNRPNTVWIAEVASEPLGLMASPTAIQTEGQKQFNLTPVGAGPFKVKSNTPGQEIVLAKNPRYWDAKHVYLSSMIFKATSPDPNANYIDLEAGQISADVLSGILTSPPVIQQALQNTRFTHDTTPNDTIIQMPVNTTTAPFNNIQAREALDYCLNRQALAQFVTNGYAKPAWIYGGPSETIYPQQNGKASLAAAKKLMPYQYNVAKGKALVDSLGGLSFTWSVLNLSTQLVTVATAVQQQWAECGIKANISPVAPNLYNAAITRGSFQLGLNPSVGQLDPRLDTVYVSATSALNSHGVNDPVINKALDKSYADTGTAALRSDWTTIWAQLNKDAVDIPLLSSGNYNVYSPCIHDVQYNYGQSYLHAWLSCKV